MGNTRESVLQLLLYNISKAVAENNYDVVEAYSKAYQRLVLI